jgi:hypothetical protein
VGGGTLDLFNATCRALEGTRTRTLVVQLWIDGILAARAAEDAGAEGNMGWIRLESGVRKRGEASRGCRNWLAASRIVHAQRTLHGCNSISGRGSREHAVVPAESVGLVLAWTCG